MSTSSGSLRGPRVDIAQAIIETALTMTRQEAERLSVAWLADPNGNYMAHCAMIQDALEMTGRTLSLGWFEAIFRYQDWTLYTKALHAVADAVVATLVSDVVPAELVATLMRPWVSTIAPISPVPEVALRS